MFQLFDDNSSVAPRTYAIKSYKKKKRVYVKKILLYLTLLLTVFIVAGIVFLSANNLI
ncbi:MAG: hypothetical protein N3I35_19665 [Clostridia bacterium]|nr:hypothetical protein [Clostridia bacterium]